MVWTYHSVKELKQKHNNGEKISIAEKRKLEKYIRLKKKAPCTDEWSQTQLKKAEKLLFFIKKDQKGQEVAEVQA